MHETIKRMANAFAKQRVQRRRTYAIFTALALVVSTTTTYLLVQPASTMAVDTICSLEEHTHGEECFELQVTCVMVESEGEEGHSHAEEECACEKMSVLICEEEEWEAHTHDAEACYGINCGRNETEGHIHGDACYGTEEVLSCTKPLGHDHSAECYPTTRELVCTTAESDGHSHGDGCYGAAALTCQDTAEDHAHGDGCYGESALTCSIAVGEGSHTHSGDCYTENTATEPACGQDAVPVHNHTCEECYTTSEKLICEAVEEDPHAHDDSCIGLVCENTEGEGHFHDTVSCYEEQEFYTCGKEEKEAVPFHTHVDECREKVMVCALEEHTHDENCYPETYCGDVAHTHTGECYVEPQLMILLPEGAEIPEGYDVEYSVTDADNRFTVAVYAPGGALPEGAELMAELLDEGSDEYAAAEEALETEYDGMVALDVRFELDGEEVEPEKTVYVFLNVMGLLPSNAVPESVTVHHIKETKQQILNLITIDTEVSIEVVADSAAETGIVEISESVEVAALDMTAAFEVDSFSTFAATYTAAELSGGVYNRAEEELYFLAMRQEWGDDSSRNGQLVTVLDYANTYPAGDSTDPLDIDIYIDAALPSEYSSNGLVLGLQEAESAEVYYAPGTGVEQFMKDGQAAIGANGDLISSKQNMETYGCGEAVFVVGRNQTVIDDGYGTTVNHSDGQIVDIAAKYKGEFGAVYRNIGYYNGEKIDLRVTVVDYAVHVNDYHRYNDEGALERPGNDYQPLEMDAVIGLFAEGKRPGIAVTNISWVELKYEFFKSGTSESVTVKGNTTYWDVDEYQSVFLDDTCQGIYITNDCVLNLGWFDEKNGGDDDPATQYRPGFGVYEGAFVSYKSSQKITACAFTEIFEVPAGSGMNRVFNFQNTDIIPDGDQQIGNYGPYGGNWPASGAWPYTAPDGNIYNSGLPVNREGSLFIRKTVTTGEGGETDSGKKFDFTMTLGDNTINGAYGHLTFVNGVANFSLAHNEGVQMINLPEGTAYTITETPTDEYTESVTMPDGTTVINHTITGTIRPSVEYNDETGIPTVSFVNAANSGSLVINKTVKGIDPAENGAAFGFTLTSPSLAGKSFNNGVVQFDSNGVATIEVAAGTPYIISGLPAGAQIQVVENDYDGYAPSWSVDGEHYTNGFAASAVTIPAGGEKTVSFVNAVGPVLPSTGGIGTRVYVIVGSALMIGASLILIEQERRRRYVKS